MAAMSEDEVMAAALRDAMLAEIAAIEAMPEHKFSRGFERKMKKLFAQRTARPESEHRRMSLKRKAVLALLAALIAAFVAGCASLAYYLWNHYKIEDYGLYSLLDITDIENAPTSLEERYEIGADMSGYSENVLTDEYFHYWIEYKNPENTIIISFSQYTKETCQNVLLNTENALVMPREVSVHNCNGIFYQTFYGGMVLIWDSGDYVLDMIGNGISQDELFALAESVRKVDDPLSSP